MSPSIRSAVFGWAAPENATFTRTDGKISVFDKFEASVLKVRAPVGYKNIVEGGTYCEHGRLEKSYQTVFSQLGVKVATF